MFKSTPTFLKNVDRATSNLLLEPDWDAILAICDALRQEDVSVRLAAETMKKKLQDKNPHTVLLAIQLIDAAVKNCGKRVHDEIITLAFMDELVALMRKGPDDVRARCLEIIQCWAHGFREKPQYRVVKDTVDGLKMEGYKFPAMKQSDALFVAESAPEWVDGEVCYRCRDKFSLTTRKHHCRHCGLIFCSKCSSKASAEIRVCDSCCDSLNAPKLISAAAALRSGVDKEGELPAEYLNSPLAKVTHYFPMSQPPMLLHAKVSHSVWRLQYEIPTEKFLAAYSNYIIRVYKAQIQVPKHRRYAGVSASVWTIELTVGTSGTGELVSASIYYGTGGVKCPETISADFCIRPAVDGISPEKTSDARITHRGGKWTMNGDQDPLSVLAVIDEYPRYMLRREAYVLLTMTLYTEKEPKVAKPHPTNSVVLNTLFTCRTLADCTLICKDQTFPAHRAILAAQSQVFAAMFDNEMKEKMSGVCQIEDVRPEILEILLKFAYIRGPVPVDADLMELWSAADKYDMEDLCVETERTMMDSVKLDNAVEYLVFARECGLKGLKVKTAEFIGAHAQELV